MSNEVETPLVGLQARHGSPLAYRVSDAAALRELPDVSLFNLRLDPDAPALAEAVRALGVELPLRPNTVAQGRGVLAMWLAPDEWLLRAEGAGRSDWAARIEAALAGRWFAVTEQTSGHSVVQLHGPGARDVLNAGCPLDLHPRALTLGQCAQSHFFKTGVLLRPLDEQGEGWELIVRRSFADYAVRMLMDAMQS